MRTTVKAHKRKFKSGKTIIIKKYQRSFPKRFSNRYLSQIQRTKKLIYDINNKYNYLISKSNPKFKDVILKQKEKELDELRNRNYKIFRSYYKENLFEQDLEDNKALNFEESMIIMNENPFILDTSQEEKEEFERKKKRKEKRDKRIDDSYNDSSVIMTSKDIEEYEKEFKKWLKSKYIKRKKSKSNK